MHGKGSFMFILKSGDLPIVDALLFPRGWEGVIKIEVIFQFDYNTLLMKKGFVFSENN